MVCKVVFRGAALLALGAVLCAGAGAQQSPPSAKAASQERGQAGRLEFYPGA